jgi:CRISPR-associated exonuclease Cas4
MMGDRDYRSVIKNAIESVGRELEYRYKKDDISKIHASEVTGCLRRAFYDRTDEIERDRTSFSDLIGGMFRQLEYGAQPKDFSLEDINLETQADLIVDDLVMVFRSTGEHPESPPAKDLLYINACMYAYDKVDGVIIYITGSGEEISFSVTKNKKMFEETIRRVRVLNDLLKEKKTPILETSIECSGCQYYERCYTNKKAGKTINFFGAGKDFLDSMKT